ncbi:hypothetical protein [Prevotella aurantiaca]|nr:hypothetical protein [Prevotella aurantiaca]
MERNKLQTGFFFSRRQICWGVVIKVRRVDGDVSACQSHFPVTRRPAIL